MKLHFEYKLKSAALQFALFIAVLIALLLGSLVLYVYTFVYLKEQSKAGIDNIQLADSGINCVLENSGVGSDTINIPLLETQNQSIKVTVSQWGIFEKAYVIAQHRKKKFIKAAIIGSVINTQNSPVLYLQETYNPLSVVGNAKIIGNAFLPKQGIKPGYISGQSYFGTQLIYGTTKLSALQLPEVNSKNLQGLIDYIKTYKPFDSSSSLNLDVNSKQVNSFKEKTKAIYSRRPILLQNCTVAGNIIIKSDTLIRIKSTANLKDIILIAPVIEIESQTQGNFQAIASKGIKVGADCKLSYPSALILMRDNENTDTRFAKPFENQIYIDKGTIVKGIVSYLQPKSIPDFNTQIVLEAKAKIIGQVYCQGNFELKGTVSGCVLTRQFIANSSGSVFVNHIFNGTIENDNIPNIYGGMIMDDKKKAIIQWLY